MRYVRRITFLLLAPLLLVAATVLTLDRTFPLDLTRARTLSPELLDASGRVLSLRPAADGAIRLATGPDVVSNDVIPLLLAREDRRFWSEPGVDPLALIRAAGQLVRFGHIVSGGSTIAMQVARLLEPHPRTLLGKLHDLARAMQLEADLGKRQILQLYLTLAPMGGAIEGVRAASLLYFGYEPASLTRSQAALLVSLPQSPSRRRPDHHPEAAWRAASRVLTAAGDSSAVVATAVSQPVLPSTSRYLAQRLSGQSTSTLDADLQAGVEALAEREARWLGPDVDIAALVIRNRDRAVLAYLGGARFFAPGGQVDMVRARHSPGSVLKPFIYAMAFDQGLATPDTLLDDSAFRLGDYAPRDFDRAEHGPVTAAEALRQSLNRPAVRLLTRVGAPRFAVGLQAAGAVLRLPHGGMPTAALALGGLGISLYDLAALYADLADNGKIQPLHLIGPVTSTAPSGALFSPRAAGMIAAILRDQPLPPGISPDPDHPVAYKTGTSYGYRDAWAAGFTPGYTVIIWAGRRNNTALPGATGRDVAAPILFRIFALLPREAPVHDRAPAAVLANLAPSLHRMSQRPPLHMLFPPNNAELAFDPSTPIDLRAAGGAPPYHWSADGQPLAAALWVPSGPGFAHLGVTDGDGHSVSVDVRLVNE